jgi:hypothetical protein
MDQNRKSRMEPAEGSRETALENERSGGEQMRGERMRNRESSSRDLGSSSDRAMMTGRGSEARDDAQEVDSGGSSGMTAERGQGRSGERNADSSGSRGSKTGGITNRDLDREQSEQEQLPERGRSQSER